MVWIDLNFELHKLYVPVHCKTLCDTFCYPMKVHDNPLNNYELGLKLSIKPKGRCGHNKQSFSSLVSQYSVRPWSIAHVVH